MHERRIQEEPISSIIARVAAALITWIASFGRHLFAPPVEGVLLKVHRVDREDPSNPSFEVTVGQDASPANLSFVLRLLPAVMADAFTGGAIGKDKLLEQMKVVTNAHDSILERL